MSEHEHAQLVTKLAKALADVLAIAQQDFYTEAEARQAVKEIQWLARAALEAAQP